MRNPFVNLYSPDQFQMVGHEVVDMLAGYLEGAVNRRRDVLTFTPSTEAVLDWMDPLPVEGGEIGDLLTQISVRVLESSLHVHHPRNLGHQVAPPLPLAALADLVSALTNQAMAVYETGPSATLIERQVIAWLCELLGWNGGGGVLTSGGALANLTALLAARQVMSETNVWKDGVGTRRLRILASEFAHYSVSRAAGIMGLGTDAVVPVATDARGSMCPQALRAAYASCLESGTMPFVVVGTAGCTPTGSIDPLAEIAEFCQAQGLWFHVDGVHGASALLTSSHRAALAGIELADSVSWDGHKLLYVPATVSAVLFRNPAHADAAFSQEASYLFHDTDEAVESFNTSARTLECTKRMMGLKLWLVFKAYGSRQMGAVVEHVYATARRFAGLLEEAADFELLMPPQTNIVCFRYRGGSARANADRACELSTWQAAIRRALVEGGGFHLTQTDIHGQTWLRTTLMNPLTESSDLMALMSAIRQLDDSGDCSTGAR